MLIVAGADLQNGPFDPQYTNDAPMNRVVYFFFKDIWTYSVKTQKLKLKKK
jgi:hypothetical protein